MTRLLVEVGVTRVMVEVEVTRMIGGSEGDQRVLLVDEGQTTRVCINNIRYISNNLSFILKR